MCAAAVHHYLSNSAYPPVHIACLSTYLLLYVCPVQVHCLSSLPLWQSTIGRLPSSLACLLACQRIQALPGCAQLFQPILSRPPLSPRCSAWLIEIGNAVRRDAMLFRLLHAGRHAFE